MQVGYFREGDRYCCTFWVAIDVTVVEVMEQIKPHT
jgi:hypothetical protein